MKNIEQKIIRFYADKPEHVKAFDILGKAAADKASSIQEFMIAAINHYGDVKSNEAAHAEINENAEEFLVCKAAAGNEESAEDTLIEQVAGAVEAVIKEIIPLTLTSYLQVAVAGQIEKALQGVNGFDVTPGSAEGVPVTNSAVTDVTGANKSMVNAGTRGENVVEKDVVTNDMLDLDIFFS